MIKNAITQSLRKLLPKQVREASFISRLMLTVRSLTNLLFFMHCPNMTLELAQFEGSRLSPASIVDVGASHGNLDRTAHSLWPNARLALIEPNFELSEKLRARAVELGAEFHCELLGATDAGEVAFTVMGAGSSIYAERSDYAEDRATANPNIRHSP